MGVASETTVNEWDAERIAEVRRLSEWARKTTFKGADDVPTYCRWADATSPAAVLSLLYALEEAREQRDALHEYLNELCGWLGEYRYGWEADKAGSMAASERLRVLGNAQEALERIHAARAAGSWSLWNPND